jgi:hypothetical protein
VVYYESDCDRNIFVLKQPDGLQHAILVDPEVPLMETRDR